MSRLLSVTNATKAAAGVFVNSIFALLIFLGVLSPEVAGLVLGVVNAAGGVFLALTYDLSAKRIPDAAIEPPA